jgi:hypothetical protein
MRYRVKDGQAEIPPYLDKQIADVQSLKVWAHHAQHPYVVTWRACSPSSTATISIVSP